MESFSLHKNKTALLIIDIQERLAAVMKHKEAVVTNCLHLIELSKMLNIPIVVTEQYPKGLGQTVEEIRNALPAYNPIEKLTFSCCDEPAFINEIKKLNWHFRVLLNRRNLFGLIPPFVWILLLG